MRSRLDSMNMQNMKRNKGTGRECRRCPSMEFAKYKLLNTPHLAVLILRAAGKPDATLYDVLHRLRDLLRKAGENPPFGNAAILRRLASITDYLAESGLITVKEDEKITITEAGSRTISEHPAGFDTADLVSDSEIRERIRRHRQQLGEDNPLNRQYADGYNAYGDGRPITDNPFRQDSGDQLAWEDGWSGAHDDRLSD